MDKPDLTYLDDLIAESLSLLHKFGVKEYAFWKVYKGGYFNVKKQQVVNEHLAGRFRHSEQLISEYGRNNKYVESYRLRVRRLIDQYSNQKTLVEKGLIGNDRCNAKINKPY